MDAMRGMIFWRANLSRQLPRTVSSALFSILILCTISSGVCNQLDRGYGHAPMSFELNAGQTDPEVKFLSRGRGYTLFLTSTQAVLSLKGNRGRSDAASAEQPSAFTEDGKARGKSLAKRSHGRRVRPVISTQAVLRMNLLGANPQPDIAAVEPLAGTVNYFLGADPQYWHTGIPTCGKVLYREVYRGIDLVYYGEQGQLEYDFVVQPGAAPEEIRLQFEGAEGLLLDNDGGLVVQIADKSVRWPKPLIYQWAQGAKKQVPGDYVLKANQEVGFRVSTYNPESRSEERRVGK